MIKWSLSAELLALVMIIMVAFYFYDRKYVSTFRRKLFQLGLWLSAGSIVLNLFCAYTIEHYFEFPYWINLALNSLYFVISVSISSVMTLYVFDLLLEHVYDKRCRTRAYIGVGVLSAGYFILVLSNIWNGALFWFDEAGVYQRGPWNQIGYLVAMIELVMIILCFYKNKSSIGKNVIKVMHIFPPVMLLMVVLQYIFPEILLNGTIYVFVEIMLFVNFQNMNEDRDGLTGLGNRKCCFEEISLRLAGDQKFQVIMISLKNFAVINQRYGYRKGDDFLHIIAKWLADFQKDSRVFRFGNVSFALICPYYTPQGADLNLQRVRQRFENLWVTGDISHRIPACFVNMICEEQSWEATHFVECLVYMVDESKKNDLGVVQFNKEISKLLERKKDLIILLKRVIEEKRVQIWYQPVFDLKANAFTSAEALLRIPGEDGTIISPGELIPLAEEKGMIDDLSWIVIEEVCSFLNKYRDLPIKSVSINLSMQQFMNRDLCERIETYSKKYQVPVEKLKLEITERVILYDQNYMKKMMEEMTAKGFGFYLDDFGIGYSNFASVMYLPFEYVKLDRSLFANLTTNKNDASIVKMIMELFHNIGIKVISEGIETEEQLKLIRKLGTDCVQGYVFERPMREKQLLQFYSNQ